jgi:hypothetical protein
LRQRYRFMLDSDGSLSRDGDSLQIVYHQGDVVAAYANPGAHPPADSRRSHRSQSSHADEFYQHFAGADGSFGLNRRVYILDFANHRGVITTLGQKAGKPPIERQLIDYE